MSKDLGNMLSGIGKFVDNGGLLGKIMGNKTGMTDVISEMNPGMKMFGMKGDEGGQSDGMNFLDRFRQQLFMNAMNGFGGG